MSELEIDVAGPLLGIDPNDRVIAHLDIGLQRVAAFIYMSQDMYIGARVALIGVPLVFGNYESTRYMLHDRMLAVFDLYGAVARLCDIVLIANVSFRLTCKVPCLSYPKIL